MHTMECQDCEEFLSDYAEGELRGDARRCFEEHLSACRECNEKLHGINRLREVLKSLANDRPPTRLDFALRRLIRLEICGDGSSLSRIRQCLADHRLGTVLGVAAVVLVCLATYRSVQDSTGPSGRPLDAQVLQPPAGPDQFAHYVLERVAPSELPRNLSVSSAEMPSANLRDYGSTSSLTQTGDSLSFVRVQHSGKQAGYVVF